VCVPIIFADHCLIEQLPSGKREKAPLLRLSSKPFFHFASYNDWTL
jgi:hypothetical protein